MADGAALVKQLNTLWQAVNAASTVAELARQSQTYSFAVGSAVTFYLQAEGVEVRVLHWHKPLIEVQVQLQAAFGWRVATDQDEAGVYVVARRRAVVGGLAQAVFTVTMPPNTYLLLKVTDSKVTLDNLNGTLHLPPPDADGIVYGESSTSST